MLFLFFFVAVAVLVVIIVVVSFCNVAIIVFYVNVVIFTAASRWAAVNIMSKQAEAEVVRSSSSVKVKLGLVK